MLALLAGSSCLTVLPRLARAQDTTTPADPAAAPAPDAAPAFSFDELSAQMQRLATEDYTAPGGPSGFIADLGYDDYQNIRFLPERAVWHETGARFQLHAFHLGWLFKQPVQIFEVAEGQAHPLTFSTDDFDYMNGLRDKIPEHAALSGVAGMRLTAPMNRPDVYDEVVAFLGASYFRALGRDNAYGLSARGLTLNTGLASGEEFPRFSNFYVDRPAQGQGTITVYATMESRSLAGAYRFVITPGSDTVMEVTARLYMRNDVEQIGMAPLTSMFLFGPGDMGDFDDYRPRVHDSDGLTLINADGRCFWRPLNNPSKLANSYIGSRSPRAFGLMQRNRAFSEQLDAGAAYERRPSCRIEPIGDWGPGTVRLVEIPSDKETNDNIVAFWVPETQPKAGEALEFSYRMHWGDLPPDETSDTAYVLRTLAGHGGVSGGEAVEDQRKFVVDFAGGLLSELPADAAVEPQVTIENGELVEAILSKIPGRDTWRLVIEVSASDGAVVELQAHVEGFNRILTETWINQWIKA
ncbi:glucan biosynthesis protein G [Pseudooceanicola nanhaiensis]|uniref:glucan biosynthesis protein n=1 Tax=Pseudooceanicola nanhaiensis TaxID=375761 RepID=UPI001CD63A6F|nr:glucan biosynthesis protein G [Pseudooceanicola nanhaiensis]